LFHRVVADLFLIQLSPATFCPCAIVGWFSSFYNFLLLLTHQKRQSETFNLQFSTCLFSFCHLHPSQNQVTVCATAAIVRLLSKKSFSASPHLILPLLIILLGILHKSCSLQAELVASEAALEEKSWALQQSKNYRTQILQQLSRSDFEENEKEEVLGDHKRFYDIITLPSFRCLPTPWMVAPMSS